MAERPGGRANVFFVRLLAALCLRYVTVAGVKRIATRGFWTLSSTSQCRTSTPVRLWTVAAMQHLLHGEPLYQQPPMAVVHAQGPILVRCTKCSTTLQVPLNTPQVSCGLCQAVLTVPANAAPQPTIHLTPVFTPPQVRCVPRNFFLRNSLTDLVRAGGSCGI